MTSMVRVVAHLQEGNWQAAHGIVQDDETPQACWAHGIVHLLEGDDGNAGYWYRRAGRPLQEERLRAARDDYVRDELVALAAAVNGRP